MRLFWRFSSHKQLIILEDKLYFPDLKQGGIIFLSSQYDKFLLTHRTRGEISIYSDYQPQ